MDRVTWQGSLVAFLCNISSLYSGEYMNGYQQITLPDQYSPVQPSCLTKGSLEHFNLNISCPVSNISPAVKSPPTHPTEQYVVENVSFLPLPDQEGMYLHFDHPAYFFQAKEGTFVTLLSRHNRRKYRYPLLLGKSEGRAFLVQ